MDIDRALIKPGQRWLWKSCDKEFIVEILTVGSDVECLVVQVVRGNEWNPGDKNYWGFNSKIWSYLPGQDRPL